MTELEAFVRWQRDAGNFRVIEPYRRWLVMPESSKQALYEKWRKEDAAKAAAQEDE